MNNSYNDIKAYFAARAAEMGLSFYTLGLDQFLSGLQTNVTYPAMLLDRYSFKYDDSAYDSYTKLRDIGILIIDQASAMDDYTKQEQIYNDTELLIDTLIRKMQADKQPPGNDVVMQFRMSNVEVSPVSNFADGNYGYFISFNIESIFQML